MQEWLLPDGQKDPSPAALSDHLSPPALSPLPTIQHHVWQGSPLEQEAFSRNKVPLHPPAKIPTRIKASDLALQSALHFSPHSSLLQSNQPKTFILLSLFLDFWSLSSGLQQIYPYLTWRLFQQLQKKIEADIQSICFVFSTIMAGYKRSRPQLSDGTFWSVNPDVYIFNYCYIHRLPCTDLTDFFFFLLIREVFSCYASWHNFTGKQIFHENQRSTS